MIATSGGGCIAGLNSISRVLLQPLDSFRIAATLSWIDSGDNRRSFSMTTANVKTQATVSWPPLGWAVLATMIHTTVEATRISSPRRHITSPLEVGFVIGWGKGAELLPEALPGSVPTPLSTKRAEAQELLPGCSAPCPRMSPMSRAWDSQCT